MDFKKRLLQEIFVYVYDLYFTTFLQEVEQARPTSLKMPVEEFIFA